MSTRWEVRLVCDRCGHASTEIPVNKASYGQTLTVFREVMEARGWECVTYGHRQHRDHCPACAGTRR